jgi:hypothetical protein
MVGHRGRPPLAGVLDRHLGREPARARERHQPERLPLRERGALQHGLHLANLEKPPDSGLGLAIEGGVQVPFAQRLYGVQTEHTTGRLTLTISR